MDVAELSTEDLKARAREGDRIALQALRRRGAMRTAAPGSAVPASRAQWRVWLAAEKHPGGRPHAISVARRLRGVMDEAAWRYAFSAVEARHETLRTLFVERDGVLWQVVAPRGEAPLILGDFSVYPDPEAACRAYLQEAAGRPIDLGRGPLWTAHLARLGPADHVLALRIHHIIADARSLEVLQRDLALFYEARRAGTSDPLPPLLAPSPDLAPLEDGEDPAQSRHYWVTKLADPPPLPALPLDFTRSAAPTHAGAAVQLRLGPLLTADLRALATRHHATLFMTLHAVLVLLLHRYTNEIDIVVGAPVAARESQGSEDRIGLFINLVALRDRIDPAWSFERLLAETGRTVRKALAHRRYPFDRVVAEFAAAGHRGGAALFNVILALQHAASTDARLSGLTVADFPLDAPFAEYDLAFEFAETADGLVMVVTYATDLFSGATIARMAGHYRRLLEGLAAAPERAVGAVELLDAAERRALSGWNRTARAFPGERSLGGLYREQAAMRGEAAAVRWTGGELSYRALEGWSNRLAGALRGRLGAGSAPGVVAVLLERGAGWVAALLGIVKAGAAYLPLDAAEPAARLEYMLRDAGVRLVVSARRLAGRLPAGVGDVVWVEEHAAGEEAAVACAAGGESLAYVMYTSGSTGEPKGVCVSHRAVIRLVRDSDYIRLGPQDRVAQAAHAAFDAVTFEVWGPLLNGGVVEIVSREELLDPACFAGQLRSGRFTVLFLTTALFNRYAALDPGLFAGLDTLLFGGEAVDPRPVAAVLMAGGPRRLLHVYGPTESTTFASWHLVEGVAAEAATIPIGRPLANTTAHVLDGFGAVPVGVVGELYLGGAGLAQGYWRRPALTAERFVWHPEYGRLYRTGDLVRRLEDGALVFVGRADDQIKLRGYRIEPGEVEAALRRLPGVTDAAVVVEGEGEQRHLVGYVARAGAAVAGEDAAALRAALRRSLPEALVPSRVIALPVLPLTANGKLDRAALPAPAEPSAEGFASPRAGTERQIAAVWSAVLRRDLIGRNDNFFALGGDSIVSIQIVARARELGLGFAVADLFRYQTVAELAPHVTVAAPAAAPAAARPGEPVPLTPIQHWFFEHAPPVPEHFNLSVMLRLRCAVPFTAIHRAMRAVFEQHAALRLRFVETDAGRRQAYAAADEAVPLAEEDLLDVPETRQSAVLEARAAIWQRSLDLTVGPLMRAVLFATSDGQRLLWCVHHLCVDAVSWRTLLQDFAHALAAAMRGEAPQLPPPTAPFSAWAQYLEALAVSPELRAEADYWSKQQPAPPLPTDFTPRGSPRLSSTKEASFQLAATETRALLEQAQVAYRTRTDELLLTAFAIAFAGWAGHRRLQLDIEGHGRSERPSAPDVARTVGWFTEIHPVELVLPETGEPGRCIIAVKEQLRAVPQDGIGYGVLRYLTPAALSSPPSSAIVFNYLGQFAPVSDDGLLAFASESAGESRSPDGRRTHPINIDALVQDGELTVAIGYSTEEFRPENIGRLADGFRQSLRTVIAHCCAAEAAGYTPSDFPLVLPTQTALDELAYRCGRGIEALYPLSPMQRGMLFHTLYAEAGDVYFEELHARIDGLRDTARFQAAWQALVARHAVLRTAFLLDWDPPAQIVFKDVATSWQIVDWRGIDATRQRELLDKLLVSERARGFDLARAPVLRFHLLRIGEEAFRFVWCFHHALLDGWSLPLLFEELAALYQSAAPTAAPRPSFENYIAWYLRQNHDAAAVYWRGYLDGFAAPTPLPATRAVVAGPQAHAEARFALDERTTAEILGFAAERGLTAATVLQAAWALLLHRYCGETDIVYGITVSGREIELPGSGSIIGLLINTIPLRVQISATSVGDWLQQLQQQQIESRRWAFMSLAEIQACSTLPNSPGLFDDILVFENYPLDTASFGYGPDRLRISEVTPVDHTSYPLAVIASADACLRFRIGYDPWRFAPEAIDGLFANLRAALAAVVRAAPQTPVEALAPLDPAEAERIRRWSLARAAGLPTATLVDLFAAQVRRHPDRVAVTDADRRLTYAQLDARARRLARRLRRLGADCDKTVGLYLERSAEIVVGILGILQSGAAYLPLDPALPAARHRFMLEDAQAAALVTQRSLEPEAADLGFPYLVIDDAEAEPGPAAEDTAPRLLPTHLAYLIYTSGSTGQPKGVMVTHTNVARLFAATEASFGFSPDDVWTLLHNFAFDFSVWEIWGALLYGGRLVVVPQEVSRDPDRLHALLRRERVTVLNQTPSTFRQLIPVAERAGPTLSLRLVVFGGEALDLPSLRPWFAVYCDARPRLVNMYGITETTVHVTELSLSAADTESTASLIGRPLADLDLMLLDRKARPVPVGAAGEIHVGGPGLARCYLNRAELTAERFVEIDVFGGRRRLYRSGDLARWRSDGALEFLGRADDQVKLRGFRIELGEVEANLAQHPAVREAVVGLRGSDAGQHLVAFIVCADSAGPADSALREWLAARLPAYMVPARFVRLERLPLTRNGKVDRNALPEPGDRAGLPAPVGASPRSPAEAALARIWSEVLGLTTIGIDDDFFALGGHSLIAMRIAARIHHALGVRIPVGWIFEHPTIAALAPLVLSRNPEPTVAIMAAPPRPHYPLSHAQQRLWLDLQIAGAANYNMPEALAFAHRFDMHVLRSAIATLVERHESLRTRITLIDGEPRQSVLDRLDVIISELDFTAVEDVEARTQAVLDAEAVATFDLAEPPLFRVILIRQPGPRDVLLIVMHHIIGDGWSRNVLYRELAALYQAYSLRRDNPLPPLAIQYKDYAVWEIARNFSREEAYWLSQLADAPTFTALPHDFSRSITRRFRGDRREKVLATATADGLRRLAARHQTSLSNVLLALFKLLLFRMSGQDQICLGMITANRIHPSLDTVIGCFVNVLPIRTRLQLEMDFDDLLNQVTATVADALDHQEYPNDMLVRHMDRGDDSARRPFLDVIYVYQSAAQARIDISGEAVPTPYRPNASLDFVFSFVKADLCLNIADHDGAGIGVTLEYDGDLFAASTIERYLAILDQFARSAMGAP